MALFELLIFGPLRYFDHDFGPLLQRGWPPLDLGYAHKYKINYETETCLSTFSRLISSRTFLASSNRVDISLANFASFSSFLHLRHFLAFWGCRTGLLQPEQTWKMLTKTFHQTCRSSNDLIKWKNFNTGLSLHTYR